MAVVFFWAVENSTGKGIQANSAAAATMFGLQLGKIGKCETAGMAFLWISWFPDLKRFFGLPISAAEFRWGVLGSDFPMACVSRSGLPTKNTGACGWHCAAFYLQ